MKRALPSAFALITALSFATPAMAEHHDEVDALRERLPEEEVVYFVLPDRFANGDESNDLGG